jgi:hypothetical protein
MTANSLTFIPFNKQSFTIGLLENDGHIDTVEKIIEHTAEKNCVFSDLSYELVLNREDIDAVQDVRIYVNDTYEPSTFDKGRIYFPSKGKNDTSTKKIFLDCYGFVELSLTLIMDDGTSQEFHTEYLPVLVRRGQLNDAVKAMVNYVYNHQELLLLNGEPKPRNLSGLKESRYRNLASQIILAEEIAAIYEANYGYFKANSRFQIKKATTIDRLERLQYVTPATLEYIASHPEQLKAVNSNVGIRIGNRIYQPQKTLSLQNINSYDIYENRIVLSFLRKMLDEVVELKTRCDTLLQQIPNNEDYSAEYTFSSFFMFAETRRMLERGMQQLSHLYNKFSLLWGMYRDILTIPTEQFSTEPRPTAIFLSVPQYNKIFVRIYQWINFGIYNFDKEKFMLSLIKISALYENYLLVKIIAYFKDCGYTFQNAIRCTYPVSPKSKYKNTTYKNTFYFSNGENQVTLYYQPVIFNTDKRSVNGIGLYRNNSIPIDTGEDDDNRQGGYYYSPDYLIKIDCAGSSKYLIIDAKFSDVQTVRKHYVERLAFKYLFSFSPIQTNDSLKGMCIIYGKCTEQDQLQSVYDRCLSGNIITPFAETLPLIESINSESQYIMLNSLIRKLLD